MTGRHRGPKQKVLARYRAPLLQRTSHVAMCFHRRVWYRALYLHHACIRRSGIILIPRLPLCQISFLSRPPLLEVVHREISCTQSLTQSPSLFDGPGTNVFALEFILNAIIATGTVLATLILTDAL